jgi:hypothetical protein
MVNKVAQSVNGQAPGETYSGDAALLPFYLAHGYVYDDANVASLVDNTSVVPADDPTLAVNREDPGDAYQFGTDVELAARVYSIDTVDPDLSVSALPAAGGTVVRVDGDNLTGSTSATVGGTAATAFSVVNDDTVQFTVPAKAAATYSVVVVKAAGNGTLTNSVTYV